jgi:hypothetical protein
MYLKATIYKAVLFPFFVGGSYVIATLGKYFIKPSLVVILIVLKATG